MERETEFHSNLVDYFVNQSGLGFVPVAQYRIMSSYGLGQVTYWNYYKNPKLKNQAPEVLYDAALNTELATMVLGNDSRCLYYRDVRFGPRLPDPPYYDPTPVNPYLGASSITTIPDLVVSQNEFDEWNKELYDMDTGELTDNYQGDYRVLYDEFNRWLRPIKGYNGSYFDIREVEEYVSMVRPFFILTQPSNLVPELRTRPVVVVEKAPEQLYQALIQIKDPSNPNKKFTVVKDLAPKHCPLRPEEMSVSDTQSQIAAESGTVSLLSLAADFSPASEIGETEIARALLDVRGDGNPVLVTLGWLGDPELHNRMPGIIRIYADADGQMLAAEIDVVEHVLPVADTQVVTNPATGERLIRVSWATGAHGLLTYFVRPDGETYSLVPIYAGDDLRLDYIDTDGAGVAFLPDGSLVGLSRGPEPLDQMVVNVFVFDGIGYRYARQYLIDQIVEDVTAPETTVLLSPATGTSGWNNTAVEVSLTATDDHAVTSIQGTLENESAALDFYYPLDTVALILDEGRWALTYSATDSYGNSEEFQTLVVWVDTTAPQTTLALDGLSAADGSFLSPIQVALSAADPMLADSGEGSGVQSIEYSLDDGQNWQAYTATMTLTALGATNLLYRAADVAGNVTDQQQSITIHCSLPGLTELLDYEYSQQYITSHGVYQSLWEKLDSAQKELDKGKRDLALKKLQDFVDQVGKETEKGTITSSAAIALTEWANCVVASISQ